MDCKYILIRDGNGRAVIAQDADTFKAFASMEASYVWAEQEEVKKAGMEEFDDKDVACQAYETAIYIPSGGLVEEPPAGKFFCVWSEEGTGTCMEDEYSRDPHNWDYQLTCYRWWDGSNQRTLCGEEVEDLELVDTVTRRDPEYNYGRAINYYVFKSESGEYLVGSDNEGYFDPIRPEDKVFETTEEAIKYARVQLGLEEETK